MPTVMRDTKGNVICDLEIDGIPHLDATFEVKGSWYKIINVKQLESDGDAETGQIFTNYECTVQKIGKSDKP